MSHEYSDSLGQIASLLGRLHAQSLAARVRPHGVLPGHLPVLFRLWEREPQTQAELCRSIRVEQPTLANTIKRMVRAGLVQKIKDSRDRRMARIALTERGRTLRETLSHCVKEVDAVAQGGLDGQALAGLIGSLRLACANLEQDLSEPLLMLLDVIEEEAVPAPLESATGQAVPGA